MMKKLNLTIFVLFLAAISCSGQSPDISTFSGEIRINNQLTFEDSEQEAINTFGQPNNITSEYWEMSEETVKNYHYNDGAKLQFVDNGLESFIITSSNYYVQMGSFELQVGNNINSIQNVFPKSYGYRSNDGTSIALGTGDYHFLLIEFNSNNIITKIELRFF